MYLILIVFLNIIFKKTNDKDVNPQKPCYLNGNIMNPRRAHRVQSKWRTSLQVRFFFIFPTRLIKNRYEKGNTSKYKASTTYLSDLFFAARRKRYLFVSFSCRVRRSARDSPVDRRVGNDKEITIIIIICLWVRLAVRWFRIILS